MKKVLFLVAAVLTLGATATFAQKIDAEGIKSKLVKADEAANNPKKGLKAASWISRGDAYVESIVKPTELLRLGANYSMEITMLCGEGKSAGVVEKGNRQMESYEYPYFTLYVVDGNVAAWTEKANKVIYPDAVSVALESYAKAMELDPNSSLKIKKGLDQLVTYYKQIANIAYDTRDFKPAGDAYMMVANIQAANGYEQVDPTMPFYAGYMYTVDGDNDVDSFVKGEAALNRAIAVGYCEEEDANTELAAKTRGDIFYYLYHCAYGQREGNAEMLQTAKRYLEAGIGKYPANEKIFEGLLQLYTTEDSMGDPSELLVTIDKTIAVDPQNLNSWFGRGRIYYALKNYDECIVSFKKVVELDPQLFEGQYYLGLFITVKGDELFEELNAKSYTDQNSYNADMEMLNGVYAEAVPYFEAAHVLKPDDKSTLEYLKQLCFRLRDEPGVMEKYKKYNELFLAL